MPETKPAEAVFRIFIRGPIELVWREITKTDQVQAAMFNMRLHTPGFTPGSPIRLRSKSGKVTGIVGEVLEFDPPHRYAHTFKFTNLDDPPCKVIFDLKTVTNGVEVTMTIADLLDGTKTAKQMRQGAGLIMKNLKSLVETGRLPIGTRVLYTLFAILEPMQPAKVRSENWPM